MERHQLDVSSNRLPAYVVKCVWDALKYRAVDTPARDWSTNVVMGLCRVYVFIIRFPRVVTRQAEVSYQTRLRKFGNNKCPNFHFTQLDFQLQTALTGVLLKPFVICKLQYSCNVNYLVNHKIRARDAMGVAEQRGVFGSSATFPEALDNMGVLLDF
ncbi:jg14676 [Pararge aegeria aegeria]|uniref:Jg14676 protein n=1 Tax=Pararge aegeria aegeria TaxID=348720 RepID=A0A8S4RAT7_9NEOP|nr:jg14676 [Pararge aegeria aegeria]